MKDTYHIEFNEEMFERVDRFLRKEMSQEEIESFLKDIKENSELKSCYQRQFNLMRGINFHHLSEMMKEKEYELSKISSPRKPIIYSIATTAVAAMLCGFIIWDKNVAISVGEQMYSSQVLRGNDDIQDLVKDKRYKEAIDIIDKQLAMCRMVNNQDANNLKYQKALILLMDGKKRKAKEILKELNDNKSNEILNKLIW